MEMYVQTTSNFYITLRVVGRLNGSLLIRTSMYHVKFNVLFFEEQISVQLLLWAAAAKYCHAKQNCDLKLPFIHPYLQVLLFSL